MQAGELVEHAGAADELARRDPDLARAIAAVGPLNIRPSLDSSFAALCRSIVFQQLAGRAAAAIYGRFVQAVGPELTAEAVLDAPQPALRGAGLSAAKTASVPETLARRHGIHNEQCCECSGATQLRSLGPEHPQPLVGDTQANSGGPPQRLS